MPNIFFTADTHFGHGRIIKYCGRPFLDAQTQDDAIMARFNEVIKPGDILYHLGDIAWSSYDVENKFLKRLNTKEVHLIKGNHDSKEDKDYLKMGFRTVQDYKEIRMDIIRGTPDVQGSSTPVILFHYAMRSWNKKFHGALALYGHSHGQLEPGLDRSMDVGVDTHNFYPWAWEDVKKELNSRPIFSDTTKKEYSEYSI